MERTSPHFLHFTTPITERTCVLTSGIRSVWVLSAWEKERERESAGHEDRASLLHERFFVSHARTREAPMPSRSFSSTCISLSNVAGTCTWIYASVLVQRRAHTLVLVRFIADRRWCIVSCVSIVCFSFSLPPIDRRFPPSSSVFLSPALLTNAGYNSIAGHDS